MGVKSVLGINSKQKIEIIMIPKKRIKGLFMIIFILLLIILPKLGYAEIIETIDFETGDYSQCYSTYCHTLPKDCMGGIQDSCIGPARPMQIDSFDIARMGNYSSKHTLHDCAMRSEIRGEFTIIGRTYWYGWSYYIPKDFNQEKYTIVNQMNCYPCKNSLPGKGAGHKLHVQNTGWFYNIQRSDGHDSTISTYHYLGSLTRGTWTDFVMYVRWTGNKNGFLKIWKNGNLELDYTGRTWWNNEELGPFFCGGEYKGKNYWATERGDPAPVIVYLDEIRVGNIVSNYAEVRPGRRNIKKPSNFKATVYSENEIKLTWKDNSNNENHFWIEKLKNDLYWERIATVGTNLENYIDKIDTSESPSYSYRIAAENHLNISAYSNIAHIESLK